MIPIRLRLQNFLSYRAAEIDFSGIHVACMSGANGSGKSTLLDAITWAMWEKARSHEADALIRQGQQEMWVEFVFRLEGDVYRVIRRRQRSRSAGVSGLELQILGEQGFRIISGKGVREAQQKINQILRMDYTTFINSAFILQGRADEFTTRSPGERKEVLARILGLGIFDELQAAAREELTQLRGHLALLTARCRQLEDTLQQEEAALEKLPGTRADLTAIIQDVQAQEERLGNLKQQELHCGQALKRLDELRARRLTLEAQRARLLTEQDEYRIRMQEIGVVLADAPRIEAGYRRWCKLQLREQRMTARADRYHQLQRERTALAGYLRDAQHELELARQRALEQLHQREEEAVRLHDILADAERIRYHHRELHHYRQAMEQFSKQSTLIQQLERRQAELERAVEMARQACFHEEALRRAAIADRQRYLQAEPAIRMQVEACRARQDAIERHQVDMERVQEKGRILKAQLAQIQADIQTKGSDCAFLQRQIAELQECDAATCPTCHNHLSSEDLDQLIAGYCDNIGRFNAETALLEGERAERERELEDLRRRYKELQSLVADRDEQQRRIGKLEAQLKQLATTRAEMEDMERELAEWQCELARKPPGVVPQRQLNKLRQQVDGIVHDANELTVLQARVQDLRWSEGRHMQLVQAEERMEMVAQEMVQLRNQVAVHQGVIEGQTFARPERAALHAIEAELHGLDYVPDAHSRLRRALAEAREFAQRRQQLQGARLRREHNQMLLDRGREQLRDINAELVQWGCEMENLGSPGVRLPTLQEQIRSAQECLRHLQAREHHLRERLAVLEEAEHRRNRFRDDLAEQQRRGDSLVMECRYYEILVNAYGKNGVQAVIIENALPEIEDSANEILRRLSYGRMHVALSTRKEAKSADKMTETLEILISDELGTRSYQLFSGGEAFRVNFALRLALSKLLARRAGAKLQTLIIDEGFGTLDEEGRRRLVEALRAIQDDFEKILIITHLNDLKEAFPARIEVVKEADGSSISVRV